MKTAVISGGAGGLGRALSAALRARGWRVYLLDLNVDGLMASEQEIPVQCDLTDSSQLTDAMGRILEEAPELDLVVYNAGVTHIGSFESLSPETHRKVFDINYFAAVGLARACLMPVRARQGVHLAISSVAGFAPLHHRTAYAASKHALEGFFRSLRSEEKPFGVGVQIAAPSFVATNLGNAQQASNGIARPGSAADGMDYMTPEAAAAAILRGLDKRAATIPVGRVARASWWINRLFPEVYQRLMERKIDGA